MINSSSDEYICSPYADYKPYFNTKKNYKKKNPAQLSTTFGVRIPNELAAAIDRICVNGVTRPEVIRLALYEYMEKHS